MAANSYTVLPLEEEEIQFLERGIAREVKEYMAGMRIMLIVCVVLPVLAAFLSLFNDALFIPIWQVYLYGQLVTGIVFLIAMVGNYWRGLYPLRRDLQAGVKWAMTVQILSKRYVAENHSRHFYITGGIKVSIQVNEADYDLYQIGDEITVECTPYSRVYLGYY